MQIQSFLEIRFLFQTRKTKNKKTFHLIFLDCGEKPCLGMTAPTPAMELMPTGIKYQFPNNLKVDILAVEPWRHGVCPRSLVHFYSVSIPWNLTRLLWHPVDTIVYFFQCLSMDHESLHLFRAELIKTWCRYTHHWICFVFLLYQECCREQSMQSGDEND